jgi:hypothetical protein
MLPKGVQETSDMTTATEKAYSHGFFIKPPYTVGTG